MAHYDPRGAFAPAEWRWPGVHFAEAEGTNLRSLQFAFARKPARVLAILPRSRGASLPMVRSTRAGSIVAILDVRTIEGPGRLAESRSTTATSPARICFPAPVIIATHRKP